MGHQENRRYVPPSFYYLQLCQLARKLVLDFFAKAWFSLSNNFLEAHQYFLNESYGHGNPLSVAHISLLAYSVVGHVQAGQACEN